MSKMPEGCVKPAGGPIGHDQPEQKSIVSQDERSQEMLVKVGKPAPDFETSAYANGGFENIKLSDYKGKWVTLCFYPGDFTFV